MTPITALSSLVSFSERLIGAMVAGGGSVYGCVVVV